MTATLSLQANALNVIPNGLLMLSNVTSLHLNNNPREEFSPSKLRSLSTIRDFSNRVQEAYSTNKPDMAHQNFSFVPPVVCQILALTEVNMSHYDFRILPAQLADLWQLFALISATVAFRPCLQTLAV